MMLGACPWAPRITSGASAERSGRPAGVAPFGSTEVGEQLAANGEGRSQFSLRLVTYDTVAGATMLIRSSAASTAARVATVASRPPRRRVGSTAGPVRADGGAPGRRGARGAGERSVSPDGGRPAAGGGCGGERVLRLPGQRRDRPAVGGAPADLGSSSARISYMRPRSRGGGRRKAGPPPACGRRGMRSTGRRSGRPQVAAGTTPPPRRAIWSRAACSARSKASASGHSRAAVASASAQPAARSATARRS
jgi:hypothetical protein